MAMEEQKRKVGKNGYAPQEAKGRYKMIYYFDNNRYRKRWYGSINDT